MGDGDGYPPASSAVSRTAPIATVWDCPRLLGTSSSDTLGDTDLPPLTLLCVSWQFPLEKGSHPSPTQASPPLAQQLPPASASPACPP